MLMVLYNVSISVSGLRYIGENPRLITLIWSLLNGKDTLHVETHQPQSEPLGSDINYTHTPTLQCYS